MPKIDVNGLNVHYWQSGAGSDLVLVHGLGGNLGGWHLSMVPQLQESYRVTTYDLRGHGRSDAPPTGYTTLDMSRDLAGLMDALDIERAHLLGHSWGGDILLHFGVSFPERARDLTVIEPGLLAPLADFYQSRDWDGWPYVHRTLEATLGRKLRDDEHYDVEKLLKVLIEIPIMYGPAKGRPREEEIVHRVGDILRPLRDGPGSDGCMTLEQLREISVPTLLLYEENSNFLHARDILMERLPKGTSASLPRGELKHFTSLEHPDAIVQHTLTFLSLQEMELGRAVGGD